MPCSQNDMQGFVHARIAAGHVSRGGGAHLVEAMDAVQQAMPGAPLGGYVQAATAVPTRPHTVQRQQQRQDRCLHTAANVTSPLSHADARGCLIEYVILWQVGKHNLGRET